MTWTRLGRGAALAVTGLLLIGACAADDDDAQTDETTDSNEPAATGPAPGVTDDTIKVGVTYVDTEALVASGLNYDLGPHEDVYDALFDAINAEGGIHGRMIEPVYAPINPTQTAPAEEACVKLTEDDDVFVVMGFFLNDAVMCPLQAHETAVVGGGMTHERLEAAAAPWVTWLPDSDQPVAVVEALHEQGELDGTVGVYSATRDQALMEDTVIPALEELGVEPAETGVMDAPPDDPTAVQASVEVIAERFDAAGVDTVVIVGASAAGLAHRDGRQHGLPAQAPLPRADGGTCLLHERRDHRHVGPRGSHRRRRLRPRPGPMGSAGGLQRDGRRRRASRSPPPTTRVTTPRSSPSRRCSRPARTWPCSPPSSRLPGRT